jgi:RNA polymerase sigma-70 factor (ECF subfamily)
MTDPPGAELHVLHQRLLAGDVTAPRELAERLIPLVKQRLGQLERRVEDPATVRSAIGLVIARYLRHPDRFDPRRGGLVGYLAMEARGDVLNDLDALRRRRRHERPVDNLVELERPGRDSTVEDEVLERVKPVDVPPDVARAALRALSELDELDRRLLQMMADGVRSTAAFAAVLELSHLPVELQRKAVKRHKDRLGKRLERLRERLS